MKIYTKTGDAGQTGLIGGSRVSKSDARLDCYGSTDELNAALGLARVAARAADRPVFDLDDWLAPVQDELFVLGSHLATPAVDDWGDQPKAAKLIPPVAPAMIQRLEDQIDAAEAELPPLSVFILPGGTELSARLHVARTICRRCERLVVSYAAQATVEPLVLAYLNRLSDWLFVIARLANHRADKADVPWKK